ncbi:MAG TPA: penicillin-binding transpeptidase domain-containing protein [Bacillota bacterium]|mgnify:CR=1 FL=1|nr:PASTA domain-containing protein [Bacillota bacterium]HOA35155.1 penicillin-binding transpeptidase domain-containing protein [Bacillota bacterium]HOL15074.1 penicillin-binding transpeptidase domain-containing protein [Bacillota bacterium]HPZ11655.1 penicillin-binding transpeptidase domain-containing protein [Bacillota bacterium]HQE09508.1 penicillin-binding transpeptidase domain-containing protein [Bacillota bacterium]
MLEVSVTLSAVRRRVMAMFFFIILAVAVLIGRLAWLQILRSEELYDAAWEQWNRTIPARSPRGQIYDREGKMLAGSATVDTVVAVPAQIEDPGETAKLLAPLLDLEEGELLEKLTMNLSSIYLKRKVAPEISQAVRELDLPGIVFTTEGQRFYPNGTLASQLLGFVGMDEGLAGLEAYYEEYLKGKEGYLLFPSDNLNRPIPHEIKRFVPPKEGMDLYLTIDETIQYIIERELARAMIEFQPKTAMAIAADPHTGAILAVASKPDYDPLRYEKFESKYWTLPPVTSSFEPGSTFKLVTLCAAVEEGLYNEKEYYFCRGFATVGGHNIHCWTGSGHGSITYLQAVESSCNPAFINLGQRLGEEKLFGYIRAFGYGKPSGIDYPGESGGLVFEAEQVGPAELATSAFGQGVSVTPLQQVMAVSAIANGGKLMKPYLVQKICNVDGEVVYEQKPELVRQVISKSTAEKVAWIMENVTIRGSGMNAAIEGYRIATKTGTAQKPAPRGGYIPGEYVVSIIGFVPVEDPQIVLYVAVDGASRGPQWGSQIGAPLFKRILTDVINYLQVPPSEKTDATAEPVEVPDLRGLTVDDAAARLDTAGLMLRLIGEGQYIVNQTPKAGAMVSRQTQIVAYLGEEEAFSRSSMTLPDLSGFTVKDVGQVLNWLGLYLEAEGSGIALRQEPASGSRVEKGDVIKVFFGSPLEQ